MTNETPGRIIRQQSGFYTVYLEQQPAHLPQTITCRMRGRLKRKNISEDILAIGDMVNLCMQSDGTGTIEAVKPRRKTLERLTMVGRGAYRQILLANADQALLVFACAHPT